MAIDPTTGLEQTAVAQPAQPIQPVQPVTYTPGQNFSFDSNQYLPGIQQQASSIYDPQRAQIQALQSIGQQQAQQQKVTTNEQFDKELQARIEAINARGAFFGGGAIDQQNQIGTERTRALTNIDLQQQAANAGFLAQQAGLNAAQAQYVQDQLSNAQTGAYGRWKDAYSMWQDEQAMKRQEELDKEAKRESKRNYKLAIQKEKNAVSAAAAKSKKTSTKKTTKKSRTVLD